MLVGAAGGQGTAPERTDAAPATEVAAVGEPRGSALAFAPTALTARDLPFVVALAPRGAVAALLRRDRGPPGLDEVPGHDTLVLVNLDPYLSVGPVDVRVGGGFLEPAGPEGRPAGDRRATGAALVRIPRLDPYEVYAASVPVSTRTLDHEISAVLDRSVVGGRSERLPEPDVLYATGAPPAACEDGLDDDFDGFADWPDDEGCDTPRDPSEQPDCNDGIDNDGDLLVDHPADPGCRSRFRRTSREDPACQDGIDDDGDGLTDYPDDPDCEAAWGRNEGAHPPLPCGLLGIEVVVLPLALEVRRRRTDRASAR